MFHGTPLWCEYGFYVTYFYLESPLSLVWQLRVQPLLTFIVIYFLSDLYSHSINMKHFLPAPDVTFSSYSPYLSHIYTDQPNQLTNLLTTIYHGVTFQLLRCRQTQFFAGGCVLCQPPSLCQQWYFVTNSSP